MDAAFYKSIDIPIEYYLMALILMLMIGVVDFHEKRDILLSVARAFLFGYIFLVFSSTVIAREVKADYNYNMGLFWSYAAVKEGRKYLFFLNIANIWHIILW